MSADLSYIRRQLSNVRSLINKDKIIPAMRAVKEALLAMRKNTLLRSEREEFEMLIEDAVYFVNMHKAVKESGFGGLTYVRGEESKILDQFSLFISAFENELQESAQESYLKMIEKRNELFNSALEKIESGDFAAACKLFDSISKKFPRDSGFHAEVAGQLLRVKMYEESLSYFEKAILIDSECTTLYNDYAMVLRKQGRFREAEDAYKKALQLDDKNPHLFFNLGRVYLDKEEWDLAAEAGKKAMNLDLEFEEAAKLYTYAKKKSEASA